MAFAFCVFVVLVVAGVFFYVEYLMLNSKPRMEALPELDRRWNA